MLNFIAQGRRRRDRDDVGPLDAAAAADRPGDDDLLEVLHADRGRDVSRAPRCGSTGLPGGTDLRHPSDAGGGDQFDERWPAAAAESQTDEARRIGQPRRRRIAAAQPTVDVAQTRVSERCMDAINWHSFFFLLFAAIACAFARGRGAVAATSCGWRSTWCSRWRRRPGLFFLAGADFVGAMQIDDLRRRHAGAADLRRDAHGPGAVHLDEDARPANGCWPRSSAARCWPCCCSPALERRIDWQQPRADRDQLTPADGADQPRRLGMALLGVRVDQARRSRTSTLRGGMSGYLLPFEIVSVHLLVVLIGAATWPAPSDSAPARELAVRRASTPQSASPRLSRHRRQPGAAIAASLISPARRLTSQPARRIWQSCRPRAAPELAVAAAGRAVPGQRRCCWSSFTAGRSGA